MISEDLRALRDRLGAYADTGLVLAPEAVQTIVEALGDLANQTRELEAAQVPSGQRLPEGSTRIPVVRLSDWRDGPPDRVVQLADWRGPSPEDTA